MTMWKLPKNCEKCAWGADATIKKLCADNKRLRAWMQKIRKAAENELRAEPTLFFASEIELHATAALKNDPVHPVCRSKAEALLLARAGATARKKSMRARDSRQAASACHAALKYLRSERRDR